MLVKALYRYPVKSLGGERLEAALPLERGFEDDRRWMLVDARGKFITQRNHAELARYRAEIVGPTGIRIIRIADNLVVFETEQARPREAPDTQVTVWDDTFLANQVRTDDRFGELIGLPGARLVYMNDRAQRRVDPRYAHNAETVSFADGYPYLITTTGSLDNLSERHGSPVDVLRFRPNIVLEHPEPFAEDEWGGLAIGEHRFYLPKPCARCIMVTYAPETGERDPGVLADLARYRKRGNKVYFGMNAIWSGGSGALRVGDPAVTLLG